MAVLAGVVAFAISELLFDEDLDEEVQFNQDAMAACVITEQHREERFKTENYFEVTVPKYLPDEFKRFFKVNHETFEILCQHLGESIELRQRIYSGGRPPVLLEKKSL